MYGGKKLRLIGGKQPLRWRPVQPTKPLITPDLPHQEEEQEKDLLYVEQEQESSSSKLQQKPPDNLKASATEAKWLFKVAENDFSTRSFDHTPHLF